ncbi:MAG: gliding motility protein GldN [Flavobacteriaceae bacterium]|nr:gliding motility protein GldN [Flavobacteriaceae bacterium]
MKKLVGIVVFLVVASTVVWSQANAPWNTNNYKKLILTPNSAYVKGGMKKRKPVVLPPVREEDVVWRMLIWRIIDVREKMNQHFYFPQESNLERKNLMNVLLDGIKNQGLTAYDVDNDEFTTPISYQDIMQKLDAGEQTIQVRNQLTGELEDKKVQSQGSGTAEVLQFMLKEEWFFDKNTSSLQNRIIGICPIRVYEKEGDFVQPLNDEESTIAYEDEPSAKLRQQLFWVYFPEARPLLAVNTAFNRGNDARSLSYDQVFIKRFFSSFISQYGNMNDNRPISDYANGLEQIIESERIKEKILNLESDMWEY